MHRSRKRGFTLIEIMIVILIIGLLLSILLPNLVYSKYQAQWTACGQYERTIAAALESYHAQEGSYPANLAQLTATSPVYINILPTCPSNGASYASTYVPGQTSSGSLVYDAYTLSCPGTHYLQIRGVQQGFPQYTPSNGLALWGN